MKKPVSVTGQGASSLLYRTPRPASRSPAMVTIPGRFITPPPRCPRRSLAAGRRARSRLPSRSHSPCRPVSLGSSLWIPTTSPLRTEMIAPLDSDLMSPPGPVPLRRRSWRRPCISGRWQGSRPPAQPHHPCPEITTPRASVLCRMSGETIFVTTEERQPTYQRSSDKYDWYHDRPRRNPGPCPSRQKQPFIEIM